MQFDPSLSLGMSSIEMQIDSKDFQGVTIKGLMGSCLCGAKYWQNQIKLQKISLSKQTFVIVILCLWDQARPEEENKSKHLKLVQVFSNGEVIEWSVFSFEGR